MMDCERIGNFFAVSMRLGREDSVVLIEVLRLNMHKRKTVRAIANPAPRAHQRECNLISQRQNSKPGSVILFKSTERLSWLSTYSGPHPGGGCKIIPATAKKERPVPGS
jgi:hypothetical protein